MGIEARRYHITPDGHIRLCSAEPGNCPFEKDGHYPTHEDAERALEKRELERVKQKIQEGMELGYKDQNHLRKEERGRFLYERLSSDYFQQGYDKTRLIPIMSEFTEISEEELIKGTFMRRNPDFLKRIDDFHNNLSCWIEDIKSSPDHYGIKSVEQVDEKIKKSEKWMSDRLCEDIYTALCVACGKPDFENEMKWSSYKDGFICRDCMALDFDECVDCGKVFPYHLLETDDYGYTHCLECYEKEA